MTIYNKERYLEHHVDMALFNDYLMKSCDTIDRNLELFKDRFQHVSTGNKYPLEVNNQWTSGFFPGMSYLSFYYTKDNKFLRNDEIFIESFKERLDKKVHTDTHDLGFLYSLTAIASYRLTGNEEAKELGLRAADELAKRYNERGKYIQAWGPLGVGVPDVKIIIDCMMNLPLLYWATEVTGDDKYAQMATNHAYTSSTTLVREDGSVYHTYLFDPASGRPIEGITHQGKYNESTWARGQAWCVYGFTLAYLHTKDDYFKELAMKAADYYINNLPSSFVHYWDFSVTDVNPEMRDTSAASIGACGLLVLSEILDDDNAKLYHKIAAIITQALCKEYFIDSPDTRYGLIREGFYNVNKCDECTIWGDYYFLESLGHLVKEDMINLW